jgi:glutathione peroxidase
VGQLHLGRGRKGVRLGTPLLAGLAFPPMSVHDVKISTLQGEPTELGSYQGKVLLIVNVASKCGLTPQYAGLERLHERYADRGFAVLGVPCNQFGAQEPGSPAEIETFCSTNYGVTFPMTEKVEVNGPGRHPLYEELTRAADDEGNGGDIQWNFEKFVVSPEGAVVRRFRPLTDPEASEVTGAIEAALATAR